MVYIYHSFLIHSSADGHLGCFHVLAMINSAVMNIGVHVSLSDLVSSVFFHSPFTFIKRLFSSSLLSTLQFSSVAQSCLTLCYPMNRSMPGLPVHHQLPEFTQTHILLVGDAIQPPHPLLSLSPLAFNLSLHQGLFQWVSSCGQSIGVSDSASVLPMNIQDWFPLGLIVLILQTKGLSRVFSSTRVQTHQFFGAQLSLESNSHVYTWLLKNHSLDSMDLCWQSNVSAF